MSLFTGRQAALTAARRFFRGDGQAQLLVFTGVSGIGKSALLERLIEESPFPATHLLDAAGIHSGVAAVHEGGEQAALKLIREVASALASASPWWRRRWVRRQADTIGLSRPTPVRVWQWASRGGTISDSPVSISVAGRTQAERRLGWVQELLAVARAARRGRSLLLVDSCEWLMFFDDVRAELPRADEPLGVGAWFADVLEQLFDEVPGLRAVAAGTALPDRWQPGQPAGPRRVVHDLAAWTPADTRVYLSRRGLSLPDDLAEAITEQSQGLPAEVAWIADALSGALSDGRTAQEAARTWAGSPQAQDRSDDDRQRWLHTHVLARISDRNRRLLNAAAVLGTFTRQALHAVAFPSDHASDVPSQDSDWFNPLSRMSCLRELPSSRGHWQLHHTIRMWLMTAMTGEDNHRPPAERILVCLHRTAASYYEALSGASFSPQAARHRFALGDGRHAGAWSDSVVAGLLSETVDSLSLRILADAVLDAPHLRMTSPQLYADAHLVHAYLSSLRADHATAQEHAEQALSLHGEHRLQGAGPAAALAGQAAWNRSRYHEAATHWTVARSAEGFAPPELLSALAEATYYTGDLRPADELLAQALHQEHTARNGSAQAPPAARVATVSASIPLPVLAGGVPEALRLANLHLLIAEIALHLCDWTRSAAHCELAIEHCGHEPHLTALAHRVQALHAVYRWDLPAADQHVKQGLSAARSCSDKRCIALLQLAQADLAERKARWAPPRATEPALAAARIPSQPAAFTTLSAVSRLSLADRAEAAYQMRLAEKARAACIDLAVELADTRTLAYGLMEDEPEHAVELFCSMGDRFGQARALNIHGDACRRQGHMGTSEKHYRQALKLQQETGDRHGQARTLEGLAHTALLLGDPATAEQLTLQALAEFRDVDDRAGVHVALLTLVGLERRKGNLGEAERKGLAALSGSRTIGDRLGQAHALGALSNIAIRRGDLPLAEVRAHEALALSRITGDAPGQIESLSSLAIVARAAQDIETAESIGLEAVSLSRSIDDVQGQARALFMLSDTARVRGETKLAEERGQESLALYRDAGDIGGQANALTQLADVARLHGDLTTAEERGLQGLSLARRADDLLGQANVLTFLADVALAQDRPQLAERRGRQSLRLARDADDLLAQGNALDVLADAALAGGDSQAAYDLRGKAAAVYDAAGMSGAAERCRQQQGV
ncbi:tetratricopeptide repeat protein [Streptomyces europaeiscabiei]|uniref:tetratricopeptide repeat protein n=1 Tax=Streptomyces europaeiscabiei TaxID=146819 RepID=UPI00131E30AA|nr:tetratricopeptide repeat protein [Streptomyces europaeiscabiei]